MKEIADALAAGRTIQPGVTPFSEASKAKGRKGTAKEDFTQQTLFLTDIDNERTDVPPETPEHMRAVLLQHRLPPAFMYESFHSTPERRRFRVAVAASEPVTDPVERERIQTALISLSPQSDITCVNADRIYYGTDKGMIMCDCDAAADKSALLALAEERAPAQQDKPVWPKYGESIPTGQRHGTLVGFASSILKRYGITDQAYEAFLQRAAQCEEPKPEAELERIWKDACGYYARVIAANPDYLPPTEYEAEVFQESLEPADYTDVGQATLFSEVFGDKIKYTPATRFIVYDGTVWQESDIKAQGLSQELTDLQLDVARKRVSQCQNALNKAMESLDDNRISAAKAELKRAEMFRDYVLSRRKTERIKATMTEARPKVEIDVSSLDADGYLLNTPAGSVDLRTGEMKPHNPNDYCTKITSVAPDDVNAEMFAEFMDRVTCHDQELALYLQEIAGMCAVGRVLRENLIIAYGEGGNGKSTLFNLLAHVLGDYSGALSAETLTANCRKNKSPEYAELRGKRLVIAAELEEGMRLDTAIVKKLCSTDPILAEKKYKDPFSFIPSHTVILYTNPLPKIGTTDKGTGVNRDGSH